MRRLDEPNVNDSNVLTELLTSRAENALPLGAHEAALRARYEFYMTERGNPWTVNGDATFIDLKGNFEALYKRPPVALDFIKPMRKSGITGACPVCGRDSLGTLDHYLPKADYPEFSFFSRNLVPACDRCNNARRTLCRGDVEGQRAFHPYFDTFGEGRIMTIEIRPPFRAPALIPVPFGVTDAALTVVQWHITNIIVPSGIAGYLNAYYAQLERKPQVFLGTTPTTAAVLGKLELWDAAESVGGQSANGWRSCLYHGIRNNADAVQHLTERLREELAKL